MDNISLSIVSSIYQSEKTIKKFINRCSICAKSIFKDDYEIILVNDGSTDKSLNIAIEESKKNKNVKIVDLSRNFGHHKALMTGLAYSTGNLVFLIDSDLEEDPELLIKFLAEHQIYKADVIYGIQKKRKGNYFEIISGFLYYKFFNLLSNLNYPENVLTARLMNRKYIDSLLMHKETELYLIGIWQLTGFKQIPIKVSKKFNASSTYTFRKKIALVINSITSFTDRPLKFIFYLGLFITSFSFIYGLFIFLKYLIFGNTLIGWTSLLLSIWLFGGLIILILGVIGIYLSKIFIETKNRPHHLVKDTYINGEKNNFLIRVNMNKFNNY